MSGVGHDIVRHSMPTAYATSGRVCVEQAGSGMQPSSLARRASSTRSGRMQSASVVISTLRRSDTGPSSSTFHRADSAVVNDE
eukprot:4298267-Pleurochrysis_carterae.AAC.1